MRWTIMVLTLLLIGAIFGDGNRAMATEVRTWEELGDAIQRINDGAEDNVIEILQDIHAGQSEATWGMANGALPMIEESLILRGNGHVIDAGRDGWTASPSPNH